MSTPRWKAKVNHWKYPTKFITEDGRIFKWFRNDTDGWNKDTKFYITKPIGNWKYDEYTYWIYPVSLEIVKSEYGDYIHSWFSDGRVVTIEI